MVKNHAIITGGAGYKRVNPMRNGSPTDEKGKPWNSAMCFAWFVWQKGYEGDPMIKFL
ncbi:TPA: hypothetical protein VJK14_000488 [Streptococcus pyogenes]|uniref:Uncharacterized protein n=1 Tax=Streptococcus dysgalactiae TaxID=1334 RepID=A0ABU0A6M8_STRDY|nr:hypothetical protein [Streptococcus dysgalactiae]NSX62729.1 hypothetical protein [Streptococcus pyogenes]QBX14930.1 hypothetical protein Javan161_0039 [Streptococcus phage Javan161]MDQ0262754.1 hypothetical protein [Streptococcus dysgalactiae]NTS62359.1 hypothetical protein [Streptococcus pyogenes]NTS67492.1 hypothetical protein [Streptococcus pyogenes]